MVLENGQASDKAEYFDIDWQPVKPELKGKVLVPVLGDHYGVVLESGELKLAFDAGAGEFSVWYFQHRFPVDPKEYPQLLTHRMELLGARLGPEHWDFLEYQSLATAFSHLPASCESDLEQRAQRARDKEIHKRHLSELAARNPDILFFLRENVDLFNAIPGEAEGLALLDRLLGAQPSRLAYWRVVADEINYRRFLDINDLAALRMEREVVEKILAPHEYLPPDWQICGTTGDDFANLVSGLFVDPASAEVAVAPRLIYALLEGKTGLPQGSQVWANTALGLPQGRWRNVLTNQELSSADGVLEVSQVLSEFPVALLVRA